MTKPTTHGQVPEALRLANNLHCGDSACKCSLNLAASELRRQHTRIAELEAQLAAIGVGGVEPLRKQVAPQTQAAPDAPKGDIDE